MTTAEALVIPLNHHKHSPMIQLHSAGTVASHTRKQAGIQGRGKQTLTPLRTQDWPEEVCVPKRLRPHWRRQWQGCSQPHLWWGSVCILPLSSPLLWTALQLLMTNPLQNQQDQAATHTLPDPGRRGCGGHAAAIGSTRHGCRGGGVTQGLAWFGAGPLLCRAACRMGSSTVWDGECFLAQNCVILDPDSSWSLVKSRNPVLLQ